MSVVCILNPRDAFAPGTRVIKNTSQGYIQFLIALLSLAIGLRVVAGGETNMGTQLSATCFPNLR